MRERQVTPEQAEAVRRYVAEELNYLHWRQSTVEGVEDEIEEVVEDIEDLQEQIKDLSKKEYSVWVAIDRVAEIKQKIDQREIKLADLKMRKKTLQRAAERKENEE
jgi:hypothetical protein